MNEPAQTKKIIKLIRSTNIWGFFESSKKRKEKNQIGNTPLQFSGR
jgi:hypothetical protein